MQCVVAVWFAVSVNCSVSCNILGCGMAHICVLLQCVVAVCYTVCVTMWVEVCVACHTREWIMSNTWMSHVTDTNAYTHVMSHI